LTEAHGATRLKEELVIRKIKRKLAAWKERRSLARQRRDNLSATNEDERKAFIEGLREIERVFGDVSQSQVEPVDVSVRMNADIPQLAWICERKGSAYRFEIGRSVEVFRNGFFEGVWPGDFADLSSVITSISFGSGVVLGTGLPCFIQRKDGREFTFILRRKSDGVDIISNSICFCLARSGINPDKAFFKLIADQLVDTTHTATAQGVHRYDPVVAEDDNYVLYRLFYANFRISSDGAVTFEKDFFGRSYRDYQEYHSFLVDTTRRVFENAMHPGRKIQLPPVATVSTGYDSVGVAAIAKECGCEDAITLGVTVYGHDDSGTAVAQALGMNLRSFDHVAGSVVDGLVMDVAQVDFDVAKEFIATAGIGDDVTFASFEEALENRTLLSGVGGDGSWDIACDGQLGIPVSIRFAKSTTEFRLRVGYAHYPPIVASSMSQRDIAKLSVSPEMKPFSIGGTYDRPIPRRIAEEAGVPREAFGQKKAATSPDFRDAHQLWEAAAVSVMERYRPGRNLVDIDMTTYTDTASRAR
jgi:hypothetical protein